ncbi:peptidylprolyl isomerase [Effusibacillus pohliae]|uniref:peptidylprolyl isomerase n=1 Tax=Effusibacillus pohliae TaxID=232270 RepID=UPI000366CC95|nr:peptidylprolyl isomerase [Effusibacillus pohliae]
MSKTNRWKTIAAAFTLCAALTGCSGNTADTSGPVVATYNGGEVYQGEFQKQYNIRHELMAELDQAKGQSKQDFLEEYVLYQKVMVAKAKEADVKVDPNQVNAMLQQYKDMLTQFAYGGDQKKLNDQMKKLGIQDQDIKALVENSLYAQQFQLTKLMPDDKLKKFYEENKSAFRSATVYHILTKTKEDAVKAKQRVLNGEDFAKVAKEVSIDPTAKENGGKMEGLLSQYVDPFREAAASIEVGKLSDPVQTEYGFHILKVEKRGDPEPFDTVKEDLKQMYFKKNEKALETEWNSYMDELKKNANIKITLPADSR